MPRFLLIALVLAALACGRKTPPEGEVTPAVLTSGKPDIPYPPDLFNQRVEGEVMLYLVVDSTGAVLRDSTRIAKSSGQAAFDAAALEAAARLHFTPAHRGDVPITAPIQVPIHFSLPDSIAKAKDSTR